MKKIGKYEILEKIGSGGMGVVYRAHDPALGRDVAIKVILEKALHLPEIKERFYREARSSGKLLHENLTIVHDVGEVDGKPYIVMEYLKGRDLRSLINDQAPLSLMEKLDIAQQLCKGFEFVHAQNIIHRDIKPENIMVLDDGKVKILDFGIAKPMASPITQTGARIGTPWYMSPEQVKGKALDKRSDIFSFGVVFYELLAYRRPFDGDDTTVMFRIVHEEPEPLELPEGEADDDLRAVLAKCLRKDAEKRFGTFADVLKSLQAVSADAQRRERIRALMSEAKTLTLHHQYGEALTRLHEVLKIDSQHTEAKTLKQECEESERQLRVSKLRSGEMIGATISHYHIVERLGEGGMGMVYKAKDTRLERHVALKFLLPELTRDEKTVRRFEREAKAVSALDHPNICTIHEIDEIPVSSEASGGQGQLFICMAYYEGATLRQRIAESPMEIATCLDIARQVATGLAKAHEHGIVHRDIKPANIILTNDGLIKIVDFGLATLTGATKLTKTGTTVGTIAYMAPEQVKGLDIDPRCDVWALGVILYEMLTQQQPFRGEHELAILYTIVNEQPAPVSKRNPAVTSDLETIINKALQKQPENRYGSMKDMLAALEQIQPTIPSKGKRQFSETQSEVRSLIEKGKLYLEQKEYAEALTRFKAVMTVEPGNREAQQLLAECERRQAEQQQVARLLAGGKRAFDRGEYKEALQMFNDILIIDANHREAGEYAQRIERLIEQSEFIDKLLVEADFYVKREKFQQAIDTYQKVLNIEPGNKAATRGLQRAQKSLESSKRAPTRPRAKTPPPASKRLWLWGGVVALVLSGVIVSRQFFLQTGEEKPQAELVTVATASKQNLAMPKSAAQEAGAETWAPATYQLATQDEQTGDREFAAGNYPAAKLSYESAAGKFTRAKTEAETNKSLAASDISKLHKSVLSLQSDMRQEKSAAQRAGANTMAPDIFQRAVTREREGDGRLAAGGRSDLVAAQQAYAAARDGFRQAKREVESIAAVRAQDQAETSREAMLEAKRRVVGSEADKRANANYVKANQAESSGGRQFQAANFGAAQNSFQQARAGYLEAAKEIKDLAATDLATSISANQAEAAKVSMLDAKAKVEAADAGNAKYQQASRIETEANLAYRENDFDKASERYDAARKLYESAAHEASEAKAKLGAIQNLIARLDASLENEDLPALMPLLYGKSFTKKDEEGWAGFFKVAHENKVDIKRENVLITATGASVDLLVKIDFLNNKNAPATNNLKLNWKLEEVNGKWMVSTVSFK
jgi:serine/threonine protein kinase